MILFRTNLVFICMIFKTTDFGNYIIFIFIILCMIQEIKIDILLNCTYHR